MPANKEELKRNARKKKPTIKQEKFAKAYVATGSALQAAKMTYDVSSERSAKEIANQNLRKDAVLAVIEKEKKDLFEVVEVALANCVRQAEEWANLVPETKEELDLKKWAMNYLKDIGKSCIAATHRPNHTHNHLHIPKR